MMRGGDEDIDERDMPTILGTLKTGPKPSESSMISESLDVAQRNKACRYLDLKILASRLREHRSLMYEPLAVWY